jgi:cellulose biosynthesis protein BcsQ
VTGDQPQGRSLAFVSPKGGSGKTVLCASMAYLLRKAGRSVVIIDTDFSTRGISLFLFDRLLEERELNLAAANSVADAIEKEVPPADVTPVPVVKGDCDYEIILASADVEQGGRPEAKVLGLGAMPNFSTRFRELLSQVCTRLARTYDHILIDTRGGYDTSSALAASVADSYVIVCEADRLNKHQLPGLVHAIQDAGAAAELTPRLAGFIVNKATFDPRDQSFSNYLAETYASKKLGVIPADPQAINAYQISRIPMEAHPDSDFAYYSTEAFEKILSPSLTTSWKDEQKAAFAALLGDVAANWWGRVRVERMHAVVPKVQVFLGLAVLTAYFGFRSRLLVNFSHYGLLLLGAWFVLSLAAAFLDSALPLLRGARRGGRLIVLGGGLVVLFGAAYTVFIDAPRNIDRRNLLRNIAAKEKEIAELSSTILSFQGTIQASLANSQKAVGAAQEQAKVCAGEKEAATKAAEDAQRKLADALTDGRNQKTAVVALTQTLAAERADRDKKEALWNQKESLFTKELATLRSIRTPRGQGIATSLTNIYTVHDGKTGSSKWRFRVFLNRDVINEVPVASGRPLDLFSHKPDMAVNFESAPRWVDFPAVLRVEGQREDATYLITGQVPIPDSTVPYTVRVRVQAPNPEDGLMFFTFLINQTTDKRPEPAAK